MVSVPEVSTHYREAQNKVVNKVVVRVPECPNPKHFSICQASEKVIHRLFVIIICRRKYMDAFFEKKKRETIFFFFSDTHMSFLQYVIIIFIFIDLCKHMNLLKFLAFSNPRK